MPRLVSPRTFALRQWLGAWAPWIAAAAVLSAFTMVLWHWIPHGASPMQTAEAVFAIAMVLLAGGGIALGYALAWIALLWKGFVPKPRTPWHVEVRDGTVHVATPTRATLISLGDIASAAMLVDDDWDGLRGMESWCLVLRMRRGPRLTIPGSSAGADALVKSLRTALDVPRVLVN